MVWAPCRVLQLPEPPVEVDPRVCPERFHQPQPLVEPGHHASGINLERGKHSARPPVLTPTSIRPRLSWSSVLKSLARWTGLCSGATNTTQPKRMRSVHAAAKVMVWIGLRWAIEPRVCSLSRHFRSQTPRPAPCTPETERDLTHRQESTEEWRSQIACPGPRLLRLAQRFDVRAV